MTDAESPRWVRVQAQDGSWTLRDTLLEETFHPELGIEEECRVWVGQPEIRALCSRAVRPCVWDVGLGAGGVTSALMRLPELQKGMIISFERSDGPLRAVLETPDFFPHLKVPGVDWWTRIVSEPSMVCGEIDWKLVAGDVQETLRRDDLPPPDVIMYDMHSAARQPELWALDFWRDIYQRLSSRPCVLAFHTRSTAVRATLLVAGFRVGYGAALGSKEETTLAATQAGLLHRPLGLDWLKRVRRSAASWPLGTELSVRPWRTLLEHVQFQSGNEP